jgi:hypothetical protein
MSEVSDASNTSRAPETSVTGVQLGPGRLRRLLEEGASSDSHTFDDRILTILRDASVGDLGAEQGPAMSRADTHALQKPAVWRTYWAQPRPPFVT